MIYEVRFTEGSQYSYPFVARRSRVEAQRILEDAERKRWTNQRVWYIKEIDTSGLFEIPSPEIPRDQYSVETRRVRRRGWYSPGLAVDILDANKNTIASYDREWSEFHHTFEPFRQGDKQLALIAPAERSTSVIDLSSGAIVATLESDESGFSPYSYYVPDWREFHGDHLLPGSSDWSHAYEEPCGDFGFVWGYLPGADPTDPLGPWTLRYLDLSELNEGKISADDRYGQVELYNPDRLKAREFIFCDFSSPGGTVTFVTLQKFDVETGSRQDVQLEDWN